MNTLMRKGMGLQTTTTLFAALSAGIKTYFFFNSWVPCFKCQKDDLGLGGYLVED